MAATKRRLLIDADFMLYQLCEAIKGDCGFPEINPETLEPFDDTEVVTVHWAHPEDVAKAMDTKIQDLMDTLKADEAVLVFSGRRNFRKEVWSGYKANRASTIKPPAYWSTIRLIKAQGKYTVILEDCLEGDDYIGILGTRQSPVENVLVMEDKDVLTIPNVLVYRQGRLERTTLESAERYHLLQALMGDTTDGYKGCPGMGKVSAEKVLDGPGDPWVNVLSAYKKAFGKDPSKFVTGDPEAEAILNARMARILRSEDWDPKARRPILWHPDPSQRATFHAPEGIA